MGWIGRTSVAVAIVVAAGLTAGAAVQPTAKDKTKATKDKDRQVSIIDRTGPGARVFAFGPGPRLGVSLSEVSGDKAAAGGALVTSVTEDSAAEKAGLKSSDIIVEFDGERVRGVRQLQRLVGETPTDRPVKIVVIRDGKRIDLTATLEERDWPGLVGIDKEKLGEDIQRGVEEGMRGLREFRWEGLDPQQEGLEGLRAWRPERWSFNLEQPGRGLQQFGAAGRLGVTVQDLGDQLRDHFGASHGVLVTGVSPESAAARAGLKAGDVITAVAGRKIETTGELARAIRSGDGDAEVEIAVVRDRKPRTLKVKLSPSRPRRTSTI